MPKGSPKTTQDASKTVPGGLRRRKMSPNASKKAPPTPKTLPKTAPQTPLGILNSDLRGAAVLPALRAQSAAPPASQDDGGVCGVPDPAPCLFRAYPPPYPPPTGHRDHRPPLGALVGAPTLLASKSAVSPRRNAQIRKIKFPRCSREASSMNFVFWKSSVSPRRNAHLRNLLCSPPLVPP